MDINEEQKINYYKRATFDRETKPSQIVFKKSMVYISTFRWEYLHKCVLTIKINEKCFYIGLKCQSKPVCLKEEHRVRIDRESHHSSKLHDLDSVNIVLSFHS